MFHGTAPRLVRTRRAILSTTALAGLATLVLPLAATGQAACDPTGLLGGPSCVSVSTAGTAVAARPAASVTAAPVAAPVAVPAAAAPGAGFAQTGFSISVDNQPIAGAPPPFDPDRAADLALARADIDVRFDGLGSTRLLNVATTDLAAAYPAGSPVTFRASTNYPAFIDRAEIRILDLSEPGHPVVATLPTAPNGTVTWAMPADGVGDYAYVLRVVDGQGRYDETVPLTLTRSAGRFPSHAVVGGPLIAAGEGEGRVAVRRIPVSGGTVTIAGSGRPGGTVEVMGEAVPVDASGRFVVSRVLPAGDHVVSVSNGARSIVRDVNIPASDWFYAGIVDLTAGYRFGGTSGAADTSYLDSRAAFYAKGKTASGWQITAGVDTAEGPLVDTFARLNDKDPRRVLDRLRTSDDVYPTYGDGSTWYDDTPTAGAFYLRAENDTTRLTWGDFKSGIVSPGLIAAERDLYGAEIRYQSATVTANGDNRFVAAIYAAQPDTLPQRDVLRGTGGSVYFLTRQDITGGSTAASIQITDPDTGRVIQVVPLTEGVDYSVDHIQGVITLARPLSWYAGSSGPPGAQTGGNDQNLVVQYEYTPTDMDVDSTVVGGRAAVWLTDNIRLGATAMREQSDAGTQTVAGADARFQFGRQSYAELEVVRSDGPGLTRSTSTDGGLTIASTGGADRGPALGVALDGYLDLQDLGLAAPGHLSFYYERKDAGFWTLTEEIASDQYVYGGELEIRATDRIGFALSGERFETDAGETATELGAAVTYALSDKWSVKLAAEYLDAVTPGVADETGTRLDAGLRLTYAPTEDLSVYAFGQRTLARTGGLPNDHRVGIGAEARVTEKLAVSGEVSHGTAGPAGAARLTFAPTPDREAYIGYTLDPTRYGAGSDLVDNGRIVSGGRYAFSEEVSVYGESAFDLPGDTRALTNTYGISYTPSSAWTLAGSFDYGQVRDETDGDFDRLAVSAGAAWAPSDDVSARLRLEYRTEDGTGKARDRDTYMFSAGYSNAMSDDWTLLADVEALYSVAATGDYHDGEYVRGSLGFAYRPVDNERLNMLFLYTRLIDLPGEDQVSADGTTDGPEQRSHVLSFNANYDLTPAFTLGGKVGYRMSEVADRGTDLFASNTATLGALRLDWHVIHEWDLFGEGRVLYTRETGTTETGALFGVYRHLGENAKIGLGYEWGGVSDDLTDIEYQNRGVFLNLVGKF